MRRLLAVCLLSIVVACGGSPTEPKGSVTYRVTGTNVTRVDVTYENSSGGTSQESNQSLPWSYSWNTAKAGDFLYISAQISQGTGSITVTITKDGTTFKTSTSSGFASIATASGSF